VTRRRSGFTTGDRFVNQCVDLAFNPHEERSHESDTEGLAAALPMVSDHGEEHRADRGDEAEDPEGHRWWFAQRIRG